MAIDDSQESTFCLDKQPMEIILQIFDLLCVGSLLNISETNHYFFSLIQNDSKIQKKIFFHKLIQIANKIKPATARLEALSGIAKEVAVIDRAYSLRLFNKLICIADDIKKPVKKSKILSYVAGNLASVNPHQAIDLASKIESFIYRSAAFQSVAEEFIAVNIDEALTVARRIEHQRDKLRTLCKVAKKMKNSDSELLYKEVISEANKLQDDNIFYFIVESLVPERFELACKIRESIQDPLYQILGSYHLAFSIKESAPCHAEHLFKEAFEITNFIEDKKMKAKLLRVIAKGLNRLDPHFSKKIIQFSEKIEREVNSSSDDSKMSKVNMLMCKAKFEKNPEIAREKINRAIQASQKIEGGLGKSISLIFIAGQLNRLHF